jgi:hypothetical protein
MAELAAIHQELPLLLDRMCETWVQSPTTVLQLLLDDSHPLHAHLKVLYAERDVSQPQKQAQRPFVTIDTP